MTQDTEERISALEARVQELTDIEQIRRLRGRYHESFNESKPSGIPDLFSDDAELDFDYLGSARGRDELNRFFDAIPGLLPFVKQFIHNHIVDVDGDTGRGFCYLEAKTISGGEAYFVAARYDDEYIRENGSWKFKSMRLTPYFTVPFSEGWAQEDRLKMGR